MSVYVCAHVYLVSTYTSVYLHVYVDDQEWRCVCIYICARCMNVLAYPCMCMYMYMRTAVCMYIYTYIYALCIFVCKRSSCECLCVIACWYRSLPANMVNKTSRQAAQTYRLKTFQQTKSSELSHLKSVQQSDPILPYFRHVPYMWFWKKVGSRNVERWNIGKGKGT